jgi:hypothetical protein
LKTFQQIWAKLKSTYEHKDNASQVGIQRIFSLSLSESQLMIKFLEKWHNALDEVVVIGLVIPRALQVTSLPHGNHLLLLKVVYQIKHLLNYWARFFKNPP